MNKKWFKRTVLSYLPILYLTIAVIVLIAILAINEISLKEAERANRYSTDSVVHALDTTMQAIDRRMIQELRFGDRLYDYFEFNPDTDPRLLNYEVSKKLREMANDYPMIHSIYLYRFRDDMVLSMDSYEPIGGFEDRAFLKQPAGQMFSRNRWSPVRLYEAANSTNGQRAKEEVVSIIQRAQLPMGNEGVIVVNVSVRALLSSVVDRMIDPKTTFLQIEDSAGSRIYASSQDHSAKKMNTVHSSYLLWKFESGVSAGLSFGWLQVVSRVWILLGLLTIAASLIYTLAITKRNYRPIERIIQQIQTYQSNRQAAKGAAKDEFSFIQKSLEKLIDQNAVYEEQVQEAHQARMKQAFMQLLEEDESVSDKERRKTMMRLEFPFAFEEAFVSIIEIDRYAEFERKYGKPTDQHLMKFALTNVVQEFFAPEQSKVWVEWIRANRLAVIQVAEETGDRDSLTQTFDDYRKWVRDNLDISVTIGVGTAIHRPEEIRRAYVEAVDALRFKLSLGRGRVIEYRALPEGRGTYTHEYYQGINAIVQEFRLGKPDWPANAAALLDRMKNDLMTNDEILHLLQYCKSLFERAMEELTFEFRSLWNDAIAPEWERAIQMESMREIEPIIAELYAQLYDSYMELVNANHNRQLVLEIRQYIEENYGDSSLSLTHISDKFKVNGKYVSQLFKEQTGVNFVDFLIRLRIGHAKRLLLQSGEPINDIARMVGYDVPLSFARTFKKIVGTTPSDYRKHQQLLADEAK